MTNVLIDRDAKTPVYRQIAEALHAQIRAGDIRDGDRLPSERTMAAELGVNRTTVVNAYDELASLGLVSGEVGRGTVVRLDVARTTDTEMMWSQLFTQMGSGQEALAMEELLESVHLQGVISLASASADESLLPTAELQALINAAIDELGPDVFAFPDVNGAPALREAIAQRSAARGVDVAPAGILVTAGAQQGSLCSPNASSTPATSLPSRLRTTPGRSPPCATAVLASSASPRTTTASASTSSSRSWSDTRSKSSSRCRTSATPRAPCSARSDASACSK